MRGSILDEYVRRTRVTVDPRPYSILRLQADAVPAPDLLNEALLWFASPEDPTLVVPLAVVRARAKIPGVAERDDGWRRITLEADVPLTQAGFLETFAEALAREKISILPVAGYRYDHLLVHEVNLDRAVATLERAKARAGRPTPVTR